MSWRCRGGQGIQTIEGKEYLDWGVETEVVR